MTDKLQFELIGGDAILARLASAIADLEHPQELLAAVGAQLEGNINQRMDFKVDAAGNAWAPLTPATIERYQDLYKGNIPGSLLERTRLMRGSLAHNATDDYVEVGFSTDYAGYHVTGTTKMVRRDPIFATVNDDATAGELGKQDVDDVVAVIDGFLASRL